MTPDNNYSGENPFKELPSEHLIDGKLPKNIQEEAKAAELTWFTYEVGVGSTVEPTNTPNETEDHSKK
ncbi:hypothetical protein HLH17_06745 [Acinetobacter sp. ANC 5380]|uniref:Uncharacterized protein n=1 Tax=Acinetobacter terrae TaxID=2731247 RepID=A0A7Y2REK8_9GAMM|nr:hypothetical protein [Acinetobacter terrae]NNH77372.1 hypothetical protein [Acinetobacter terrae]